MRLISPQLLMRLCWRSGCVLALLGALAAGLLPGGYLPRMAGPCGRELCNCSASAVAEHAHACCAASKSNVVNVRCIRLVSAEFNSAEAPGTVLQMAFFGLLAPWRVLLVNAPNIELEKTSPAAHEFALLSFVPALLIPPPRRA